MSKFFISALIASTSYLVLVPSSQGQTSQIGGNCTVANTVYADVVALDQPFMLNRLGASEPQGMIFALRRDVVATDGSDNLQPGKVRLRDEKRPRPFVLRLNEGQCLSITLTNFLTPPGLNVNPLQPVTRSASIHVSGLEPVRSISDDASYVGANPNPYANPGETKDYLLFAPHEGVFHLYTMAAKFGDVEGQMTAGMFGAVVVEPPGAEYYRSQLTNEELIRYATRRDAGGKPLFSPDGQPLIDYGARYPIGHLRQCTPVLRMVDVEFSPSGSQCVPRPDGVRRTFHSELVAIITGPRAGRFTGQSPSFDPIPASPDRRQPFREFVIAYHELREAVQAFPEFYNSPDPNALSLSSTLSTGKDMFAINFATGGIGAEILANRIGVGPMWDCTDCKFEEFFLTAWAVGDAGMVVDIPANANVPTPAQPNVATPLMEQMENCENTGTCPPLDPPTIKGPKATKAFFADDPSNVYHSYLSDHVKFRLLHASGNLTHVHHQHAQQWLHTPNDQDSSYLDSQMISPGATFTLEVAYNGSGNRNKTIGDSIFHCHFYPHFAAGMWAMWRVHDVMELGTVLDANGRPVRGSRALPDAEILTGTPIPAIVPMPSLGMPPLPGYAWIDAGQIQIGGVCANNTINSIPVNGGCVNGRSYNGIVLGDNTFTITGSLVNPGYPFFIPGIAGKRAPHPPFDFACQTDPDGNCVRDGAGNPTLLDGGLPRHVIFGGTVDVEKHNVWDFTKDNHTFQAQQLPEDGTAAEKAAIAFHGTRNHPTYTPEGTVSNFVTNGLPRNSVPGAPFADPAVDDEGNSVGDPIIYKAANIQMNVVFNKKGWHYPQQRFITLWEDIMPTLNGQRRVEPFFIRANSHEHPVEYWHTNLVPNYYELDDFQVRTPTDILGQHIHLVKFDVLASDGASNGFNYEDGTFAAQEVRERIDAINAAGGIWTADRKSQYKLQAKPIPDLGPGPNNDWVGAQATVQRWWADPLMGTEGDRTIRTVFTHDHYGPSTHQQAGLYAGLLVEPKGSTWTMQDGTPMRTRRDGGPTSWEAVVLDGANSYREFALEFGDLSLAYGPDSIAAPVPYDPSYSTITPDSKPWGWADCLNSINNSLTGGAACQQSTSTNPFRKLQVQPHIIAGGLTQGTMTVNYRNEPLPLRLFDPKPAHDPLDPKTDLAFVFASMPRYDADLNVQPAAGTNISKSGKNQFLFGIPYAGASGTDPYTPIMRAYQGDDIKVRVLVGAHLLNHHVHFHGLNWKFEPSGEDSGWRDNQGMGISEHFEFLFRAPLTAQQSTRTPCPYGSGTVAGVGCADYLYNMGTGAIELGQGIWGLLRAYNTGRDARRLLPDLKPLPQNESGGRWPVGSTHCPEGTATTEWMVSAQNGKEPLVYNNRIAGSFIQQNTPLRYILTGKNGQPLFPGDPPEPLVLRARAGDCISVVFKNDFDPNNPIFKTADNAKVPKNAPFVQANGQKIAVYPSVMASLQPQLVSYDVTQMSGLNVGVNPQTSVVKPGGQYTYKWYAGKGDEYLQGRMVGKPVEFGAASLFTADPLQQAVYSMTGALVIEPAGTKVNRYTNSNTMVEIFDRNDQHLFREFVAVVQDMVYLSQGNAAAPSFFAAVNYGTEPMSYRYGLGTSNTTPAGGLAQAYSNELPAPGTTTPSGEPRTPIFRAIAGEKVRFRVLHPNGLGGFPDSVWTLHGHAWAEEPYTNSSSVLGFNRKSQWIGARDGFGPGHRFDMLIDSAGGTNRVPGDYLYESMTTSEFTNGTWGIFRVLSDADAHKTDLEKPKPRPHPLARTIPPVPPPRLDPDLDRFDADQSIERQKEQTPPPKPPPG